MSQNKEKLFHLILITVMLVSPFLFWPHAYIVGGDDSGLYYLFPELFLKNYVFTLIGNSVPGGHGAYFPQLYQAPFFLLLYITKLITFNVVNVQKLFLGVNIVLSYFIFKQLFRTLATNVFLMTVKHNIALTLGAFLYAFSPLFLFTIWYHLLSVVYLQFVFPLIFLLWVRSITEKNYRLLIIANLVSSFFMVSIMPFPFLLGSCIAIMPIAGYIFYRFPIRSIISTLILILLLVLTNLHIFAHLFIKYNFDYLGENNVLDAIVSNSVIRRNEANIINMSNLNKTVYSLFNQPQKNHFLDSNLYTLAHGYFDLNYVFIMLIIVAAIFIKWKNERAFFTSLIVSFIITLRLYTISTPIFGIQSFLFFNKSIPFFTGLRTTIDKFAIGYSIIFSLLLSLSVHILLTACIPTVLKRAIVGVLLIIVLLNSIPVLQGIRYRQADYGASNFKLLNAFPPEYTALLASIKKMPDDGSRFALFPLNNGGYAVIPDAKEQDYYYAGLSPLLYATGKNDYTGFFGIPAPLNTVIFDAIERDDWQTIGRSLQLLNVNFVIKNKAISDSMQDSWFMGKKLIKKQLGVDKILGEKIASFGNKFELYKLQPQFASKKIYLSAPGLNTKLTYRKNGSNNYSVSITGITEDVKITFTETGSALWKMVPHNSSRFNYHESNFFKRIDSPDYQNIWSIDYKRLLAMCTQNNGCVKNKNQSIELELRLFFLPDRLVLPTITFSIIAHILLIILYARNKLTIRHVQ